MADVISLVAKNGTPTISGNTATIDREQVVATSKYVTSGLWYWEVTIEPPFNNYGYIGIGVGDSNMSTFSSTNTFYLWTNNNTKTFTFYKNTTTEDTFTNTILTAGETVGIVLDATNKTIQFFTKEINSRKYDVSHMSDFTPILLLRNASVTTICRVNFGESDFLLLDSIDKFLVEEYITKIVSYDSALVVNYYFRTILKSDNKFYSYRNGNEYIPYMASASMPYPYVVTHSTNYGSFYSWKVFDGDSSTAWLSDGRADQWVQIDFGSKKKTDSVKIYCGGFNVTNAPKEFQILGSHNGVDYVEILNVSLTDSDKWEKGVPKSFEYPVCEYRYYKIHVFTNMGGANYVEITEAIFGLNGATLINIPQDSVNDFINYGQRLIKIDNKSPIRYKNYILSKNESENADGLWVQEIDRKPLSIKFE